MKVEIIYEPPFAGGIGYAPLLVRVKRKYFTLEFHSRVDIEAWRSLWKLHDLGLAQIVKRKGVRGRELWKRHAFENHLTASAFVVHVFSQLKSDIICPACGDGGRRVHLTRVGEKENCVGMKVQVFHCPHCKAVWEIPGRR